MSPTLSTSAPTLGDTGQGGGGWLRLRLLLVVWLMATHPVAAQGDDGQRRLLDLQAEIEHQKVIDPEKQRVLVLNSYNVGYAWTDREIEAIGDAFADEPDVVLRMEFMDTKLINTPEHFALLADLYANKYHDVTFDVIIATDDDALSFLREYRESLFPGTPVVFAGINNFTPAKIEGMDNVTGVNEQADFRANLDLIRELQPEVRDIFVITDELTAGKMIRKEFETAAREYEDSLDFHFLNDLTIEQVSEIVGILRPTAAVFYLTFFHDVTGRAYTPQEAIPLISSSSAVPVYGQVDYMIGEGVLGGRMKTSYYQGQVGAELAKRILDGESADDLPIIMASPNQFMFDYDQLQRFGIRIGQLPQDSIIVNEPRGLYYKYKTLIWGVVVLIVILVAFILVLLFNIRRRKRAQHGLHDILVAVASVLEQSSAKKIKEELVETINRVIFLDRAVEEVETYNYSGPLGSFDADKLIPLKPDSDDPPSPTTQSLIQQAVSEGGSVASRKECVALFKTDSIHGNVVYLKGSRRFEQMDRDLLEILTSNVSMAMETLEKSKIQESLEAARQIQLSMLPHDFDRVAGPFSADICAELVPAREVGGDLYDIFAIDEDHLCLAVGDVADKGIPAALFMAMAKTLIRGEVKRSRAPAEILREVNRELCRENDQCVFVTLFLGVYHRPSEELRYANGGHNAPYLIDDQSVQPLHLEPGPALGIVENWSYKPQAVQLRQGDALFLFSDGVTEAEDTRGDMYGEERLVAFLANSRRLPSRDLTTLMLAELETFSRGAGQADDITVLFVRMQ